jgi:shikimate dehydrogenase
MRKYGLIGYPLGHSFSKKYFSEKFLAEHIANCSYENFPLKNLDEFPVLVSSDTELYGLNVTIPYKSAIIRFLDVVDKEAGEIGAVNVIKIVGRPGKIKLYGYNSDVTGIRETLLPFLSDKVRNALVLGTGGSSMAVCHVLKKFGLKVDVVSRDRRPGVLVYSEIDRGVIEKTQLIINTTPLGMFPDIESKPDIGYEFLNKDHILFDLVYNPEVTEFLRMGAKHGCKTISGIKMLHSQAEKAWAIWNNDMNHNNM